MEYLTLIGIVIIVAGFALKLDVLATVIISGLVTGLVSGMSLVEILEILGSSFVSNRLMSIFLIIFPVIAIIERYGLKERAAYLIGKIKNASAGKVLAIYSVVRTVASALNIRIGGVVQFVRPLVLPMAQAAGEKGPGGAHPLPPRPAEQAGRPDGGGPGLRGGEGAPPGGGGGQSLGHAGPGGAGRPGGPHPPVRRGPAPLPATAYPVIGGPVTAVTRVGEDVECARLL